MMKYALGLIIFFGFLSLFSIFCFIGIGIVFLLENRDMFYWPFLQFTFQTFFVSVFAMLFSHILLVFVHGDMDGR